MKIPRYLVNFSLKDLEKEFTEIAIIGSGITGLLIALKCSSFADVSVFSKEKLKESETYYAQGGIAIAISPSDSPELHFKDTIKTGDGLSNKKAVKILVEEGIFRIQELILLGVNFDKTKKGISLGLEGGHSQQRIIHAKGDATGEEIEKKLIRNIRKRKNINIYENFYVIDILTYKNRVFGIIGLEKKTNTLKIYFCKAVVISTGGIGQIYKYTTNPKVSTGCGIGIAYRCGCEISDMEFVQFHPTALNYNGKTFLISEAVRGEGAILRNYKGEEFMKKYHPERELAPRDIVSRAIIEEMNKTKKEYVYLDLTHLGKKKIIERFPNIYKNCKEAGFDLASDLIPVAPAAHYSIGGIKTNFFGETNIKGIYAAGESASTGVHGANRLASNSLLECLVFGDRVSQSLKRYISKTKEVKFPENFRFKKERIKNKKINIEKIKNSLKEIMWENAGIIRSEKNLKIAKEKIEKILSRIINLEFSSQEGFELQNMLIVADNIVKSALLRKESRGVHYRIDYPERDDKKWLKHIVLKR
jgi:L-aspartate oxidase